MCNVVNSRYRMIALAALTWSGIANAGMINLVTNGEFEATVVPGVWDSTAPVPRWSSTSPEIELWSQGAFGSPTIGSDGLATGQHLEINFDIGAMTISQTFMIPAATITALADLTYDVWFRGNASGEARLLRDGVVVTTNAFLASNTAWTENSFNDIAIAPGETWGIAFATLNGTTSVTPHIDQVEFLVEVEDGAVPAPATLALIGLG